MLQPTLLIPTDCPACKAKACGHVCKCGSTGAEKGPRTKCPRQHRYCCTCGECYEVVAEDLDST